MGIFRRRCPRDCPLRHLQFAVSNSIIEKLTRSAIGDLRVLRTKQHEVGHWRLKGSAITCCVNDLCFWTLWTWPAMATEIGGHFTSAIGEVPRHRRSLVVRCRCFSPLFAIFKSKDDFLQTKKIDKRSRCGTLTLLVKIEANKK